MSDIKVINDDALLCLAGLKADLVIADIPWVKQPEEREYRKLFFLLSNACLQQLTILVDNCLASVALYLKLGTEVMYWRYHGIWLHENTFTHIFGFFHQPLPQQYHNILRFENKKETDFSEERPLELMEYLMMGDYSSVLDPFMGSGSAGVAAQKLGLDYTGIEIDKETFKLAESRLCVKSL